MLSCVFINFLFNFHFSPRQSSLKSASSTTSYSYVNLEQVLSCFPLVAPKYVNMYALIKYLDVEHGVLHVRDETCASLMIIFGKFIGTNPDFLKLFQIGNIIRVHRVQMTVDNHVRCSALNNVVVSE